MSKILVTGGCGYIGSHTIVDLLEKGYDVVCIDNLVNSSEDVLEGVRAITGKKVINNNVDLCNREAVFEVFRNNPDITGVIHFAALKAVGESVDIPMRYYYNNTNSLLFVLEAMVEFGVPNIIFSSSCSVYGNSAELPVTENTPLAEPESPYARTKQIGESILRDFCKAYPGHSAVLLRYFNPAGAHESALIGESPATPASNLVPVITETAIGLRPQMTVFGNDYDTRDGSCVRDFIHIMDLANAHTLALQYLAGQRNEQPCEVFNLGIGTGVTVLEAIHAFEQVSGQRLNYAIGPRRQGDVIAVYADNTLAASRLHWSPSRDIAAIMRSAWAWEQRRNLL